jgi:hypothetical protein
MKEGPGKFRIQWTLYLSRSESKASKPLLKEKPDYLNFRILISRGISPGRRTRTPSTFPSREFWPCDHRLVEINAKTLPQKRFLNRNHSHHGGHDHSRCARTAGTRTRNDWTSPRKRHRSMAKIAAKSKLRTQNQSRRWVKSGPLWTSTPRRNWHRTHRKTTHKYRLASSEISWLRGIGMPARLTSGLRTSLAAGPR